MAPIAHDEAMAESLLTKAILMDDIAAFTNILNGEGSLPLSNETIVNDAILHNADRVLALALDRGLVGIDFVEARHLGPFSDPTDAVIVVLLRRGLDPNIGEGMLLANAVQRDNALLAERLFNAGAEPSQCDLSPFDNRWQDFPLQKRLQQWYQQWAQQQVQGALDGHSPRGGIVAPSSDSTGLGL